MGKFYTYTKSQGKELKLYSERGLLTYFSIFALDHYDQIIKNAINGKENSLSKVVNCKNIKSIEVYCEFELGVQGFGNPDGGLLIEEENGNKSFIFIEAKATTFDNSFKSPDDVKKSYSAYIQSKDEKYLRENTFNSSINGQIELKWRFVDALRASTSNKNYLVSEQYSNPHQDYLDCDRFYWRLKGKPNKEKESEWRRVKMDQDLNCLYNSLRACLNIQALSDVQNFYFLAITDDDVYPSNLNKIRLLNSDGASANIDEFIYWLPISFIEKQFI